MTEVKKESEVRKEKEILYFRENAIQSIISDVFMYGGIMGLMYFNHKVLNGSTFVDSIFILFMLLSAMGRTSKRYRRFTSYDEMLKYLKSN